MLACVAQPGRIRRESGRRPFAAGIRHDQQAVTNGLTRALSQVALPSIAEIMS
jgi:hypothetical protein